MHMRKLIIVLSGGAWLVLGYEIARTWEENGSVSRGLLWGGLAALAAFMTTSGIPVYKAVAGKFQKRKR